ncbi:MAG: hypothetical protein IK115_03675 [Lachnospiraceae bacterium]|nr:hypothetical protein [Lachnospiraceae bacterium]
MEASVIRAKLGLLIRLIDTTTGAAVEESNVRFFVNGQSARPAPRGGGCFVFINTEREDIRLDVEAFGFEKAGADVRYEELDDRIPTCDIFLIPSERNAQRGTVIGIFGNLPFLEALEAITPDYPLCRLGSFNVKGHKMTVIKQAGRALDMDYGYYGILQADGNSYEKIIVSSTDADSTAILKKDLQLPYTVNAAVCRIIFGSVDAKGNYLLRIRDKGGSSKLLVRYVRKGEEYFQRIDLKVPEECVLNAHLQKKKKPVIEAAEEKEETKESV